MASPDVAIIGGGIAGTAAAALLAEAGVSVELFEREALASAASGRNSGAIQHPYDPVLAPLHVETLELYRWLTAQEAGFSLPSEPAGVLLVARERGALEATAAALARESPELDATLLDPAQLELAEPSLARGLQACRLATGYPVRPAAATEAFAVAARRAGALLRVGEPASPWLDDGRVRGVTLRGQPVPAGAVLVAAGPWTRDLVDRRLPIAPVWGVNVEVEPPDPPAHVLEELGVEKLAAGAGPPSIFSLVAAGSVAALGSTFLPEEPDAHAVAPLLLERGQEFVPSLRAARVLGARTCPRPQSADGRPLLGPLPERDGLHVSAGHGPWGVSIGPGSARLVVDALLGRDAIPAELRAERALID